MYFCNKTMTWKESQNMPKDCNVKAKYTVPKGQYRVIFERRRKLYVDVKGTIYIIESPYEKGQYPEFVKLQKVKGKWSIKK